MVVLCRLIQAQDGSALFRAVQCEPHILGIPKLGSTGLPALVEINPQFLFNQVDPCQFTILRLVQIQNRRGGPLIPDNLQVDIDLRNTDTQLWGDVRNPVPLQVLLWQDSSVVKFLIVRSMRHRINWLWIPG